MRHWFFLAIALLLCSCQREDTFPEATSAAMEVYAKYADREDLTVALLGGYDGYNAVMMQADDIEGWHRLLEEFAMRSHSEERLPKEGEKVSAAYMKSYFVDTVPTEDASVGDLFVDIMDSLIRVSVDTAYSITRTEHWDNGVLVDSTCDTGSSPFTTHQSSLTDDAVFQAARAHGDAGYLAYTDSESLALWLFFYADRQGMVHVINTIVNR